MSDMALRPNLSRVDIVNAVQEECVDTVTYADILANEHERELVRLVVGALWRSIKARVCVAASAPGQQRNPK